MLHRCPRPLLRCQLRDAMHTAHTAKLFRCAQVYAHLSYQLLAC